MNGGSRMAVWLWIAVLVVSGLVLTRMTMTTDLTALLPRTADRMQNLLVAQLRDGVAARLILIGLEGAAPEELAEGSRRMAARLQGNGLFSYVNNGDPANFAAEQQLLMRYRYLLSPAVTPEHFTPAALRAALEDQLRLLGSPAGAVMKAVLPADPTGELSRIMTAIFSDEPPLLVHGVWFSRDGTRAQLVAESNAPGFDLDRQQRAVASIHEAFHDAGLPASARLLVSGPAVFAVESRETIERDSWRLSLVAGALVLALLTFVYRSLPLVLLSLLPVLTGLVVGMAAVQLLFGYVHGITLGFGATLIGEAVDYPAYLFTHLAPGEHPSGTLKRIWPTLRLAVMTTVFGGFSMLLSSFTGLSQLGTLTVIGVLAAGAVTRWVLPLLAPQPTTAPAARFPRLAWHPPVRWKRRGRWLVWAGFTAAVLYAAGQAHHLWDDDLSHLSPVSKSAAALDERLRSELGAPDVRYLVVMNGGSREEVLSRSEAAEGLLRRLVEEHQLTGFDVPSLYVPSKTTQERRRAALPDPVALRRALQQALVGLPFRANLFEPFLHDVDTARTGPLLEPADLAQSAFALKLRALVLQSDGEWTALAPLRGVISTADIAARLAEAGPGFRLLDLKSEADRLVAGYRHEALRLTVAGVIAIALVLWWGLRQGRLVLSVLLPALMAIVFAVTALVLAGERLSLFHLVSILLVLGIGLNYALFFNRPVADDMERRRTSLSLIVCIVATLSAFGTLSFSRTPVLHAIGVTVSLGAVFSLFLSAVLAQSAVRVESKVAACR